MSEAVIAKKAEEVKSVNAQLLAAESAIVVDYRGLTVEEVTDLRKQLRDANIKMSVIKNKILERAVEGTDYEDLKATFVGPTAVAFSDEDPVAPAKILKKFVDDHDALEIKGGSSKRRSKRSTPSTNTLRCLVAKTCCPCLLPHCKIQCARSHGLSRLLPTRATKKPPKRHRYVIVSTINTIHYLNIGGK